MQRLLLPLLAALALPNAVNANVNTKITEITSFSSQIDQVKIANQRESNKNVKNYFEESSHLLMRD